MKPTPLKVKHFIYSGPGDGKGEIHQAIAFSATHVATFTNPAEDPHLHGHSWYGTRKEFALQFKPHN